MNIEKATLFRAEHFPKEDYERLRKIQSRSKRIIAELFCKHRDYELAPTKVTKYLNDNTDQNWLVTSVRARINELTHDGYLVKTETIVDSLRSGKEYCWQWKGKPEQLQLELSERYAV